MFRFTILIFGILWSMSTWAESQKNIEKSLKQEKEECIKENVKLMKIVETLEHQIRDLLNKIDNEKNDNAYMDQALNDCQRELWK